MTRELACSILGLPLGASPDEVREHFQSAYSDYQIRLSNAPTPNLKKTFQEKLQQLLEAAECLHPGITSQQDDLPGTGPVLVPNLGKSTFRVEPHVAPEDLAPLPEEMPRVAKVAIGVAVLSVAFGSFALIKWIQGSALTRQLKGSYDEQMQALDQMQGQAEGLKARLGLLRNARLRVQNAGADGLTIRWVGAIYMGADGSLKTFDSAFVGYPSWTLRPGSTAQLEHVQGSTVIWSGDVVFYSLRIQVGDNDYNVVGTAQNLTDGTLKLRFD